MGDPFSWIDDDAWTDYVTSLEEAKREAEALQNSIRSISEESVRAHLTVHGDDGQERIDRATILAEALLAQGFFAPSLVSSMTAVEVVVRDMLLMPLVQGAFLSESWAEILTERIVGSRVKDREKLLPAILSRWGLDLSQVKVQGQPLWTCIHERLWPKRNAIVHAGHDTDRGEAALALAAAKQMVADVLTPVAAKLGFRVHASWRWANGPMPFDVIKPPSDGTDSA